MKKLILSIAVISAFISCESDDDVTTIGNDVSKSAVIQAYAQQVSNTYQASLTDAQTMQTAINNFLNSPTDANFTTAKQAWLDAREVYGQTEAFRECNGPVDTDNSASTPWGLGNEGQMNAWPIDESYIDYVEAFTAPYANNYVSIISDSSVTISESELANLNEGVDDKSISTGWHAIEFLLWGQDNTATIDNLPGQRDFTDYTTATDAVRRGQYLSAATSLLINDLQDLVNTWSTGGEYRVVFEALDEDVALKQLLNGAFFIAGDELSSERIIAPVDSTDGINNSGQEDEHSCFSDNTDRDIVNNAQGILNVVFGTFNNVEGASFYDLVNQVDPTQAAKLLAAADEVTAKVNAISNNANAFDYLITQELSTDASFGPVMQSVEALFTLADEISASATLIGINLE